ncbi:MAG TPA: hypothetical protein VEH55_06860 [Gaiellaceae bacterium]|nr:hypothetical protein [Gaiellaceae bacterium]
MIARRSSIAAYPSAASSSGNSAANAGADDADDRIGGFDDLRLGHVLDAHVAGAVHHCPAHRQSVLSSLFPVIGNVWRSLEECG